MATRPNWLYDEIKHAGVDYSDPAQVQVYDSRHQKFRDYQKNTEAILENIVFCHGGFLTYEHRAEPADAMVSTAVLHHLPDFWKLIGLSRAAGMLKRGGKLYLFDVVFPANLTHYEAQFDGWIETMAQQVGPDFAAEAETHIRDEYSTYDWIMEGFLTRAGFQIVQADYSGGFNAGYLCVKEK
jgi:putative AdoMet-dependent methyltransferase